MSTDNCDSPPLNANASHGNKRLKTESAEEGQQEPSGTEVVPWPGNTFVIRKRNTGRAISILNGKLMLRNWDANSDRASHWKCESSEGWLVFRNPISGTCIGHGGIHGNAVLTDEDCGIFTSDHKSLGFSNLLLPMRHPDGGYLLLARHRDQLAKMNVIKTQGRIDWTGSIKEGTVWEFIRV